MLVSESAGGEVPLGGHPNEMLARNPRGSSIQPLEEILASVGFTRVPLIEHDKPVQTAVYQFGEPCELARNIGLLVGRSLEEHRDGAYAAVVDIRYKVIAMQCQAYPAERGEMVTEAICPLHAVSPSPSIWEEAMQKHPREEFGILIPEIHFYESVPLQVSTLKSVMDAVPQRSDRHPWVLSYVPGLSTMRVSNIVSDLARDITMYLRPYDLKEDSCTFYLGREKSGIVNRAFL